eukprot:2964648-Amphidinium_carterae.1
MPRLHSSSTFSQVSCPSLNVHSHASARAEASDDQTNSKSSKQTTSCRHTHNLHKTAASGQTYNKRQYYALLEEIGVNTLQLHKTVQLVNANLLDTAESNFGHLLVAVGQEDREDGVLQGLCKNNQAASPRIFMSCYQVQTIGCQCADTERSILTLIEETYEMEHSLSDVVVLGSC